MPANFDDLPETYKQLALSWLNAEYQSWLSDHKQASYPEKRLFFEKLFDTGTSIAFDLLHRYDA